MFKLIVKRAAFFLAFFGILVAGFLILKTSQKPPESKPLRPPPKNPFGLNAVVSGAGIIESLHENLKISSAVSGLVKKVFVSTGDQVQAGDLLIELDDRQLRGQRLVLEAEHEKLKSRVERLARLKNPQALSEEERDTIAQDLKRIEADLARLDLLLDQLKVRAPVSGKILQLNTRPGEFVAVPLNPTPDFTPPILMSQGDTLQVRVDIDEVNIAEVQAVSEAVALIKGTGNKDPIPLEFIRIEPFIVPKKSLTGSNLEQVDTRVLQIIFRIKSSNTRLYIGQQVDVYLKRAAAESSESQSK